MRTRGVSKSLTYSANGKKYIGDYISITDVIVLLLLGGMPFFFSMAPVLKVPCEDDKNQKDHNKLGRNRNLLLILLLLHLGFIVSLWIPFLKFPATPFMSSFNRNMLFQAMRASWEVPKQTQGAEIPNESVTILQSHYRAMTNSIMFKQNERFSGIAKGANLLFIVLETAPYWAMKLDSEIGDFPTLQRLSKNSFICFRHFSTYPYTPRAYFSIYSGIYPSQENEDYISLYPGLFLTGPISALRKQGYATAIFTPDSPTEFENEEALYRSLGFSEMQYPNVYDHPWWSWFKRNSFESKQSADRAALEKLKKYLSKILKQKTPFAISFNPQLGHGPWDKRMNGVDYDDLKNRGKKIIQIQDEWLGEIVNLLEENGVLNKTIIVVVGDHGTRTSEEQPGLHPLMEEAPFHVPFILFAPQALKQPYRISYLTSHIDIATTISELMGFDSAIPYSQGLPVWEKAITKRTTFFLSGHYHGGNSYYRDGIFVSYHRRSGNLYAKQGSFSLEPSDAVDPKSTEYQRLLDPLEIFIAFQNSYVARIHFEQSQTGINRHLE